MDLVSAARRTALAGAAAGVTVSRTSQAQAKGGAAELARTAATTWPGPNLQTNSQYYSR